MAFASPVSCATFDARPVRGRRKRMTDGKTAMVPECAVRGDRSGVPDRAAQTLKALIRGTGPAPALRRCSRDHEYPAPAVRPPKESLCRRVRHERAKHMPLLARLTTRRAADPLRFSGTPRPGVARRQGPLPGRTSRPAAASGRSRRPCDGGLRVAGIVRMVSAMHKDKAPSSRVPGGPRHWREEIKADLAAQVEAGGTLYGFKPDGTWIARTRDGDRVIRRPDRESA